MRRVLLPLLTLAAPAAALEVPKLPPSYIRAATPAFVRQADPNCRSLPVVHVKDGVLYKDGKAVARDPRSWAASCSGALAWEDGWAYLYKDGAKLGDEQSRGYRLTRYSGHVLWVDGWGRLWRDGQRLSDSRPAASKASEWTGDVAWTDAHGTLFVNLERVSGSERAQQFHVAQYTGDVVWVNPYDDLYKNKTKLGRTQKYDVAPTGDVAWEGFIRGLYKNERRVADSFERWLLREDGRLIWWDGRGNQHSE